MWMLAVERAVLREVMMIVQQMNDQMKHPVVIEYTLLTTLPSHNQFMLINSSGTYTINHVHYCTHHCTGKPCLATTLLRRPPSNGGHGSQTSLKCIVQPH